MTMFANGAEVSRMAVAYIRAFECIIIVNVRGCFDTNSGIRVRAH